MFKARNITPLSSAVAGGSVVRADGSLLVMEMPGMADRTASFTIYRGTLR